jgi:polyketide synthase PksN
MNTQNEPIAIIGMAGIFPKAENIHQYWDNILQAVDCITDAPKTRASTSK